jgi:hypothetical protein
MTAARARVALRFTHGITSVALSEGLSSCATVPRVPLEDSLHPGLTSVALSEG